MTLLIWLAGRRWSRMTTLSRLAVGELAGWEARLDQVSPLLLGFWFFTVLPVVSSGF